jgi:hypothetical protein
MKLNISDLHPLLDRETEDIPVILVTLVYKTKDKISGEEEEVKLYFSTDNGDVFTIDEYTVRGTFSRTIQYLYCPMQIKLPTDNEGGNAQIVIDNVSQHVTQAIRNAQVTDGCPKIKFEIILLSPDIPESRDIVAADFPPLDVVSVTTDQFSVTADIKANSLEGESFPGRVYSPSYFPGIFGR